jgi:predicted O-methyltransferase YrrM
MLAAALAAACTCSAQPPRPGRGGFGRGGYDPSSQANPPVPKTESEKRILGVINQAVQKGETYANVPAGDGRVMRLVAEAMGAKHVVEIGTSTGLSGMWFAMALEKTGGKLTTFEIDPGRAAIAREHFKQAGVDKLITIVEGDAHALIAKLQGPVDVVFIDADKEGYIDYLKKLLPLVRPGGVIMAHNVDMNPEYFKEVTTNPDLETVAIGQSNGLALTLKKR